MSFGDWWMSVGSGLAPQPNEDQEEHAHRVAFAAYLAARTAPPTEQMIDRGAAFALNVKISGEFTWSDYVRELYQHMSGADL